MSQDYRYYCLDSSGRLHDTTWFKAASDDGAVAQVETKHPNDNCEIWQGRRLVGKVAARRLSA